MKNIGEIYFKDTKMVSFFRILAALLIISGAAIFLFGYGFGMVGIPIAIIGIIVFFICSSKIVGDKVYDSYIADIMKEIVNEDDDFDYIKSWEFSAYSIGDKVKRGKDSLIRTDNFTITKILMNKTKFKLIQFTVSVSNEVKRSILLFDKEDTTLSLVTRTCGNDEQYKLNYVEIISAEQQTAAFPVPANNYDVEEMIRCLASTN